MEKMVEEKVGGQDLTTPSVSYGNTNLYMRGPLEVDTRPNLTKVRQTPSLLFCTVCAPQKLCP